MTNSKLQDLTDDLKAELAEHQRLYEKYGDDVDRGYVNAYKTSLSLLWIYTDHEYGQSRDEQQGGS